MEQIKFYTYATPKPFGGFVMPVPAQNSCMREYVSRQGGSYVLPLLELMYDDCYLQLFRLIESVPINSQLCVYSALMLPRSLDKIKKIDFLLSTKKITFHFVFERLVINSISDLNSLFDSEVLSNYIICETEQVVLYVCD